MAVLLLATTSQYSAVLVGLIKHVMATEYNSILSLGLTITDVVFFTELATVT